MQQFGMGMPPAPLPPVPADPMLGAGMMPPDPMMGGVPGAGMPPVMGNPFPSTDPMGLAEIVRVALEQAASQDHAALEMQQQMAAMDAGPIIDQMLMQAAAPQPDPMMGAMPAGPDPMMAFGETEGLTPMPVDPAMGL